MTAVLLVLWLIVAVVVLGFLAVVTLLVYGLVQLVREAGVQTQRSEAAE